MVKTTIAIFEVGSQQERDYLKKSLKGHKTLFFDKPIQEVSIKEFEQAELISVFIYSRVDREIITRLSRLQGIVTRSTGYDHIDLDAAKERSVSVGNVPFYGENTVAEHTFALLLNLSRNVHKSHERTQQDNYSIAGLEGFDLKGKTIGVIGCGHIGLHVIRIAKGFGMHVKAYDLHHNTFLSEVLHFEYGTVEEILKEADVVTLHMPHLPSTHHFLNKKRLKMMKPGAILINTARGPLVDTEALYECLKSGHLGGAGLDVIEGEEYIKDEEELVNNPKASRKLSQLFRDKEIFKMENVIFTPHNAFNSREGRERILEATVENVEEFTKNKKMAHEVTNQ